MLAAALQEDEFDPTTSRAELRLHLTDIGEARFLPRIMDSLQRKAPHLLVTTKAWASSEISEALGNGQLHLAIGYLPEVINTVKADLVSDKYILLLRAGHPFALRGANVSMSLQCLNELQYVAVNSHSDTLRILKLLQLDHRIRLLTANFLALPSIVRATDLAVLLPRAIAMEFDPASGFCMIDPELPMCNFTVALHWSRRFDDDPMRQWVRREIIQLFCSHHPR
jgi:DNA-binding transcriptional LysR family regulator